MPNIFSLKHHHGGKVLFEISLFTKLRSVDRLAYLEKEACVTWFSQRNVFIICNNVSHLEKHVVLRNLPWVTKEIRCQKTLDVLNRLTVVLYLVNLLVHLPNINLKIIHISFNLFGSFALLFSVCLLSFIVTSGYVKSNHVTLHGSGIAKKLETFSVFEIRADQGEAGPGIIYFLVPLRRPTKIIFLTISSSYF